MGEILFHKQKKGEIKFRFYFYFIDYQLVKEGIDKKKCPPDLQMTQFCLNIVNITPSWW